MCLFIVVVVVVFVVVVVLFLQKSLFSGHNFSLFGDVYQSVVSLSFLRI